MSDGYIVRGLFRVMYMLWPSWALYWKILSLIILVNVITFTRFLQIILLRFYKYGLLFIRNMCNTSVALS